MDSVRLFYLGRISLQKKSPMISRQWAGDLIVCIAHRHGPRRRTLLYQLTPKRPDKLKSSPHQQYSQPTNSPPQPQQPTCPGSYRRTRYPSPPTSPNCQTHSTDTHALATHYKPHSHSNSARRRSARCSPATASSRSGIHSPRPPPSRQPHCRTRGPCWRRSSC